MRPTLLILETLVRTPHCLAGVGHLFLGYGENDGRNELQQRGKGGQRQVEWFLPPVGGWK